MESWELFYPEIRAVAGPYTFSKGVEIEGFASQDAYFAWAKIRFTPQFKPKINVTEKARGGIYLGYSGQLWPVFSGFVSRPYDGGGYVNEIVLKDRMTQLEDTYITNTFLDATPQEIIAYGLAQAGVTGYKLSGDLLPPKKTVAIYRKNVIALIKEVHSLWRINKRFFFQDDIFYWGEKPDQDLIYTFEYAKNIITLERPLGVWELVTVSVPQIKHSQKINVIHPQVTGQFEIKKVYYETNERGFIRTHIYF